MTEHPDLDDFRRRIEGLLRRGPLKRHLKRGTLRLGELTLAETNELLASEEGYYLLLAAARLTRTTLKRAQSSPEAAVVPKPLRRAFAVKERLPVQEAAVGLVTSSVALRARDLGRKRRGGTLESVFRERLLQEGIAVAMSPPVRKVPGLLIGSRKPDGVAPDPATEEPPQLYLEIKSIRRVADDIQKRLYEIAEVSLEMKLLYGGLKLKGHRVRSTREAIDKVSLLRAKLREQVVRARPVVVAFFLCPRAEAERYRAGAETFIDAVFFQEEVEECLAFIRSAIA